MVIDQKVFAGLAACGKHSTGWFFGFRLRLLLNDRSVRLAMRLTPGIVDDRKPVPALVKRLWGKRFSDKSDL